MKKSVYRIITIAAICFFCVIGILVSVNIINSRQSAARQAADSLRYMSENCAYEFRAIFDNSELLVDNMADIAERLFLARDSSENPERQRGNMEEMDALVKNMAANSKYPISLYTTLNPEYFSEDIFYVRNLDGTVATIDIDYSEIQDEWLKQWKEKTSGWGSFYWDTVEAGELWFELEYDPEMQWEVISRTKAIYDREGELLGIVCADVYVGDISKTLQFIDSKTGGVSALTNSSGNLIAGSEISEAMMKDSKYLHASSRIDDRWEITLVQPIDNAVRSMRGTIAAVIILGLTLLMFIVIVIVFVYRKHGRPIIREFEEKDILLINQARAAQMGEMVGNIAHQLKQPLNGVNMALSNLQEEYASQIADEEKDGFEDRIGRMKLRITDMAETVQDFIGFIKPQKAKEVFSVREQIEKTSDLMRESLQLYLINVEITGEELLAEGHKNEFGQCVFNIMDNARDALRDINGNRNVWITLKKEKDAAGRSMGRISILNNGQPLEEDRTERIFELYFTTKESSGGSGIGLYMTRQIIESHFGGTVSCKNTDDGVCFDILLPLYDGEEKVNELHKQS